MAETKGFEPSRRFPAYSLSRGAPSTTRPRLHRWVYQCDPHNNKPKRRISNEALTSMFDKVQDLGVTHFVDAWWQRAQPQHSQQMGLFDAYHDWASLLGLTFPSIRLAHTD